MKKSLVLMMLVLALALVACGGDSESSSDSGSTEAAADQSVENGKELYNQVVIGPASAPGCITCHSLEPDVVLVGPSHNGIGIRAGEYVDGVSAEEYMYDSLMDPDGHLVDGYAAGIMYQNYSEELDQSDIDDLVAYLLTQ